MLTDAFGDLNWAAVIVAGLAYFVLGAVWYTNALFGRQYRTALGVDPDVQAQPDPMLLVTNFVGWMVAAVAMGLIAVSVGADSVLDGIVLGLVVSVGVILTQLVVNARYEGRGTALLRVNGPYTVIGYALMGAILAAWR
jgi:hypothetical protein